MNASLAARRSRLINNMGIDIAMGDWNEEELGCGEKYKQREVNKESIRGG